MQNNLYISEESVMLSAETGKSVSEKHMRSLALERCDFHGEWNYSLSPR